MIKDIDKWDVEGRSRYDTLKRSCTFNTLPSVIVFADLRLFQESLPFVFFF